MHYKLQFLPQKKKILTRLRSTVWLKKKEKKRTECCGAPCQTMPFHVVLPILSLQFEHPE